MAIRSGGQSEAASPRRHGVRTISSPQKRGGRRVASEDSVHYRCLPVHRLRDACDLDQTVRFEVASLLHQLEHIHELLEVVTLVREQRKLREKRNDDFFEILEPPYDVAVLGLSMV